MHQADWIRVAFEGPLGLSRFDLDMRGVPIPGQGFFFSRSQERKDQLLELGRVQIDVEEKNILFQADTQRHLIYAEEGRKTGRESRD